MLLSHSTPCQIANIWPKFWEAQPLAARSTLSCLYIQEMKSDCWYKTGWVENWEAGKAEVGDWEGGGVGRWGAAGAHCSLLGLGASCLVPTSSTWLLLPPLPQGLISCAGRQIFCLPYGLWQDQCVEIVLSWSRGKGLERVKVETLAKSMLFPYQRHGIPLLFDFFFFLKNYTIAGLLWNYVGLMQKVFLRHL